MTAAVVEPAPRAGRADPSQRYALGRRHDIQGLRGIAVLLVVLYHAGVPLLGGGFVGVDVFFVLSGFLITLLLLAEIERTGRIDLAAFWSRRARRLLPASALVLVATGVGAVLLLGPAALRDLAEDVPWAALFSANWHFAFQGTDYMAQERSESLVLHFWSLGVEEQFYLAWPLLLVGAVTAAGRRPAAPLMSSTALFVPAVVAVLMLSFLANLWVTAQNQPLGFFSTPTRAWQLAAGALLAVVAPRLSTLTRQVRLIAASGGALLLAISVATLPGSAYPGLGAILPTSAAVLLVAAGTGGTTPGVEAALGNPVLRWLGDISYSLYLWHWPVLALLPVATGSTGPPVVATAVLLSVGLSVVTLRFVENPVRHAGMRPAISLALGAALLSFVLVVSLGVHRVATWRAAEDVQVRGWAGEPVTVRPNPAMVGEDYVSLTGMGCAAEYRETTVGACEFGARNAERTVVLLGDSHAEVLHSALAAAAHLAGWRLVSIVKPGCPAADVTKWDPQRSRRFTECDEFREKAWARIADMAPDVVVITSAWNPGGTVLDRATGDKLRGAAARAETLAGWIRTLEALKATGAQVVLSHEPPRTKLDTSACLLEHRDVRACSFPEPARSPDLHAATHVEGISVLDLQSAVCSGGVCRPVVGDMVVYRDSTHMTHTYVMSRVPQLVAMLNAQR